MKRLSLLFTHHLLQLHSGLYFVLFCFIFNVILSSCNQKEMSQTDKNTEDSLKNIPQNIKEKTDSNKKANSNSNENPSEKSTEKTPEKLDSMAIIGKLTKKWQITGNYWASSIQTFNDNENYFLDLQKDGKYTLQASLEDAIINETGKWKLLNPKPTFRKYEETDPKDIGILLEEDDQILVLTPKSTNNTTNKEREFLFNFQEKEFTFNAFTRPSGLFAK